VPNRIFETEVQIDRPREEIFAFFADAGNLQQITPPWVNFRIKSPLPIAMKPGALIEYTIRVHGVPLGWRTLISVWEPPFRFVDEQIKGPYSLWRHEHTFEANAEGTLCRDRIEYRSPLGWLMHPLMVDRDVMRIFEYRKVRLLQLFSTQRTVDDERAGVPIESAARPVAAV
jgi:ligand-binding SRPBCC domain-containing protein